MRCVALGCGEVRCGSVEEAGEALLWLWMVLRRERDWWSLVWRQRRGRRYCSFSGKHAAQLAAISACNTGRIDAKETGRQQHSSATDEGLCRITRLQQYSATEFASSLHFARQVFYTREV